MSSRSASRSGSETRPGPALRLALAAAAIVAAAGCDALGVFQARPAAGPEVPPGPAFDHKAHLGRGPTCADCHEEAEKSVKAPMPNVEFCMECHEEIDEKKPAEKRVSAWFDKSGKPVWHNVTRLPEDIVFAHKTHAAKKVECAECHKGIEESTAVSSALALDMDTCMACHAQRKAPNECATCHRYAGPDWKPENHTRMWRTMHGQVVRRNSPRDHAENCALCHTESSCRTCHSSDPPRDHNQAWRIGPGHGLAAALDRTRCDACHLTDSCRACHETLPPRSHRALWGAPRNRHCLSCHLPLTPEQPGGCGVCHHSTPSHAMADPMPGWHRPDFQCALCHTPMPHAENGQNCLLCHR